MAAALKAGNGRSGGASYDPSSDNFIASPLEAADGHHGYSSPRGDGADNLVVAAPLSHGSNPNSNAAGRRREDDENLVGLGWNWQTGGDFRPMFGDTAPSLQRNQTGAAGVRRLTPAECERLQALPDGWTAFGPDSRRYAALGDAVTASVAEWIGRRLLQADRERGS